jgi:ribonuclease PH
MTTTLPTRSEGRTPADLRALRFQRGFAPHAEGSVLVEAGRTRVLCTVCAVPGVPSWMQSRGEGWLTAEYSMLPGSVLGRRKREGAQRDGRSTEIQRLIGRSLRAAVDPTGFPNLTLAVDCDVIQADGGTRCASITGAMVALHDALRALSGRNALTHWPLRNWIAAVSVGIVHGVPVLDLDYAEDSRAAVDMNVVGAADGRLIEVQGTAEGEAFTREQHDAMLSLAQDGLTRLHRLQRLAVEAPAAARS